MYILTSYVIAVDGLLPFWLVLRLNFFFLRPNCARGGRQREHYIHGEEQDGGRSESRREGRRRKREIYTITHTHLVVFII